jgi:hypothetical protein
VALASPGATFKTLARPRRPPAGSANISSGLRHCKGSIAEPSSPAAGWISRHSRGFRAGRDRHVTPGESGEIDPQISGTPKEFQPKPSPSRGSVPPGAVSLSGPSPGSNPSLTFPPAPGPSLPVRRPSATVLPPRFVPRPEGPVPLPLRGTRFDRPRGSFQRTFRFLSGRRNVRAPCHSRQAERMVGFRDPATSFASAIPGGDPPHELHTCHSCVV